MPATNKPAPAKIILSFKGKRVRSLEEFAKLRLQDEKKAKLCR